MSQPWIPEIDVDERLARRLIETQFPQFAGATLRRVGQGWDNVAYLVEERFIFRFPQRSIAAPLMAREITLLPHLAAAVPVAIPRIAFAGAPQDGYPWQFAGYEILLGRTACAHVLDDGQRQALAVDLARALRALHDIDPEPLLREGLVGDEWGRLSPKRLKLDAAPLEAPARVVHGDLYARHLLVNERGRLCGIIDWGDLHYGQPAVDLMCVWLMIPPEHHRAFFDVYGEVDERSRLFARARALYHTRRLLDYSEKIGDAALHESAKIAAGYLGEPSGV
jgi:aminoglycoside phosphotransferase (APT) family kinase protein